MKKAIFEHLLNTYGRLPLLWICIIAEIIRTFALRIVPVLIIAKLVLNAVAGNVTGIKVNIIAFIIIYTAGALIGAIGELLAIRITDQRYQILLVHYYEKLIGKDMAFYRDHQTGYLAASFRQHLDGTMALVRLLRGDVMRMLVCLSAPLVILLIAKWQVGLAMVCIVGIESAYVFWASNYVDKYRKPAQAIYKQITGEVADEVTNIVAFKSSGRGPTERDNVTRLASEEAQTFWRRHKTTAILELPRHLITGLATGLCLFIAVATTNGHPVTWGLAIMVYFFLLQIMSNVADMPDLVHRYDEHIAKVYPTLEHLKDTFETVLDPKQPKDLKIVCGAIEIKNIYFSYKTKQPGKATEHELLVGLNVSIRGGERIGLVGLSGAGKSTLAGLLMRFDDVDAGSIIIDDIDIRDVRQNDLRKNISYVPQEPLLFHRSISENIAYFKKDASNEEIVDAARAAHAHEFIEKISGKYDAMVGDRGVKLSGGQRQRIILARAILKNAPILILDEATSSLDSESEQLIQNALPGIIGKHTALIMAHRLSTVAGLDRIIVLHEGKIVEQGTHEQLLDIRGHYYSLWQKQSGSAALTSEVHAH
jgi:ATP-binding cassette subfamily B protein